MRSLVLALYAEGPSDHLFLPTVIQRTSRQLLQQHQQMEVRALPVKSIVINKIRLGQAEYIVQAAYRAVDCDALIIHADADHRTSERALRDRYEPGHKQIQQMQEAGEEVCKQLLPLIPIRMTEAWMLADHETLQKILETNMAAQSLGLPIKAKQVESISNPKEKLKEVVHKAYAERPKRQRRRQINIDALYGKLAEKINLERLGEVPAYQQFLQNLTNTLKALNFIA